MVPMIGTTAKYYILNWFATLRKILQKISQKISANGEFFLLSIVK